MSYIAGLLGFALGFFLGQALLAYLLRHRGRDELLNDAALRRRYGTLNWLIALTVMAAVLAGWRRWVGP